MTNEVSDGFIDEVISCMTQEFYDKHNEWVEESVLFMEWVDKMQDKPPLKVAKVIERAHRWYVLSKGEKRMLAIKEKRERNPEPIKRRDKMGRPPKYPFDSMELFDVYEYKDEPYSYELAARVRTCASSYNKMRKKKDRRKFMIRKNKDYINIIRIK